MNDWYSRYLTVYEKPFSAVSPSLVEEVRKKLASLQSETPLVTVSIIAYNEEKHLLACLWALSEMKTRYPVEFIGVDNDSEDRTADVYRASGIPFYTEHQHSCGHARLCGLHHARGKYHVNVDADTLYPSTYVDTMVAYLEQHPDVMGVSGTWGYFPDEHHSRAGLFFYTFLRDRYLWMLSFKRPELSVRGLVFVYRTEQARKVGTRVDIVRGEDGTMAARLKAFGRIAFLRKRKVRAITGYGTVGKGSLLSSFWERVRRAYGWRKYLFTSAGKH